MKTGLAILLMIVMLVVGAIAGYMFAASTGASLLGVSQPEWVSIHPGLMKPDDVHIVSVKLFKPTTQAATNFDIAYQLKGSVVGDTPTKTSVFDSTVDGDKVGMTPDVVKVAQGTQHFSFPVRINSSLANDCQAIITVTQRNVGPIGDPIVLLIDNGDGNFTPFEPIKPQP